MYKLSFKICAKNCYSITSVHKSSILLALDCKHCDAYTYLIIKNSFRSSRNITVESHIIIRDALIKL